MLAHIVCEQNNPLLPPVAKLDIAVDSDSKGRGFESLRAGQKYSDTNMVSLYFLPTLRDEKFR